MADKLWWCATGSDYSTLWSTSILISKVLDHRRARITSAYSEHVTRMHCTHHATFIDCIVGYRPRRVTKPIGGRSSHDAV